MRKLLRQFLELESASGILLFLTAVAAMLWANSPIAFIHQRFIDTSLFWVNEGLMAVFFLVVGLELKQGFLEGELAQFSQVIFPAVAALGGMLMPALIYWIVNHHDPVTIRGWATPVATDIAFALGVLSLFGKRIPVSIKLFLLALAIFDDIGAIIIIALFYSHGVSLTLVGAALGLMLILCLFNWLNVRSLLPYLLVGAWLWQCLLYSGVHPTIAGVLLAFTIPSSRVKRDSPMHQLQDALHPWVAYLIMPLFALVNAGFPVSAVSMDVLTSNIVVGIALGLFVGKQAGVFGFCYLLVKLRWVALPEHSSWLMIYGVALLCGIGFTMSLFLGTLSFEQSALYLTEVRLGVLIGSLLSALFGALILKIALARNEAVLR